MYTVGYADKYYSAFMLKYKINKTQNLISDICAVIHSVESQGEICTQDFQKLAFIILHDRRILKNQLKRNSVNEEMTYLQIVQEAISDYLYYNTKYDDEILEFLDSNDIISILRYNNNRDNENYKLGYRALFELISKSKCGFETKQKLKFMAIDSDIIVKYLTQKVWDYVGYEYPTYHIKPSRKSSSTQRVWGSETKNAQKLYFNVKYDFSKYIISIYLKDTNILLHYEISLTQNDNSVFQVQVYDSLYHREIGCYNLKFETHQDEAFNTILNSFNGNWSSPEHEFSLVYLYGTNIHDLKPISIDFTGEYAVNVTEESRTIKITKNTNSLSLPSDFFGKKIRSVQAIIGKNGSGKSSIFELICNCELFSVKQSHLFKPPFPKNTPKYLLLYRIGSRFYYCTNFATNGEDSYVIHSSECIQNNKINIPLNVVKISNTFNLLSVTDDNKEDRSLVWDLSTQKLMHQRCSDENGHSILDAGIDINTIRADEIVRLNNYRQIIQQPSPAEKKSDYDQYHNRFILDDQYAFSSGEAARLMLFSRILNVFKTQKYNLYKKDYAENYILLIDEAELYFHPEWQRTFIKDLCSFIDKVTNDIPLVKNITIILTSNSPFYMSDLPRQCVHVITNQHEMETEEKKFLVEKKTFGQNIHSLLKNQFFMEDITGEFALQKISEAFKMLRKVIADNTASSQNTKQIGTVEKKDIQLLIELLGEPLIRDLLEQEFNECI